LFLSSCFVVSQYYDSVDRDCYWEKQDGLKHRRKLRVRVYGQENGKIPPAVFIEVKAKSFSRGVKRRLNMSMEAAETLAVGDSGLYLASLDGEPTRYERMVVDEILDLVNRRNFVSSVAIRYDRLAFQGTLDADDLRITFDYDLQCRFKKKALKPDCQDFERSILDDDMCIMELKTTSAVPLWLCQLLAQFKIRPQGFSKYCTSIEMHDPLFAALGDVS